MAPAGTVYFFHAFIFRLITVGPQLSYNAHIILRQLCLQGYSPKNVVDVFLVLILPFSVKEALGLQANQQNGEICFNFKSHLMRIFQVNFTLLVEQFKSNLNIGFESGWWRSKFY